MATTPDDAGSTAPCDKCEMAIPTDAIQCPVCGFRPAGSNPALLRVGEACFAVALVVSLAVFVAGVTRISPGLPTETVTQVVVITPYTMGASGFFVYYLHGKRQTKPTDSNVFG